MIFKSSLAVLAVAALTGCAAVDGKVWEMDMDDWMYMIDEQTVLNRTTMTKFGFRVGDVTLSFRKR